MAYFAAIPIFLLVFNGLQVMRLLNKPASTIPAPPLPRWLIWLGYSIVPLAVLTFGLGVAFRAGGQHFRTPHEVCTILYSTHLCLIEETY